MQVLGALLVVLLLLLGVGYIVIARAARSAMQRNYHRSPLEEAVSSQDVGRVRGLLEQGADPNTRTSTSCRLLPNGQTAMEVRVPLFGSASSAPGSSVLFDAVMQGNQAIVSLLLDHGADANLADAYGQTPLIAAAWSGDLECVRLLLKHHADFRARDESGRTALAWAREEGRDDVVRALTAAGARE